MTRPALIIGALGQDGSLLADRLQRDDIPVVGIARPGAAGTRSTAPLRDVDVTDMAALDAAITEIRPSRIFYLAAVHHSTEGAPDDRLALWPPMLQVNCLGLVQTVRAVLRQVPDCRLVMAASSQMYDPDGADRRIDETTPRRPRTFYGQTKSWSLDAIAFARAQEGLKGSSAILFNHESPRRSPSFVTRKVTRAAAAISLGLEKTLTVANLDGRADWGCAEDTVDALVRMADAVEPQDYIVGTGVVHSVEDLVACAFGHVGLDWRAHVTATNRRHDPVVYADPSRIKAELGWQPQRDFETVIRRMVDADLADLRRGG